MWKSSFSVVWTLYNMCIFYIKLFFVSPLQHFEKVFACGFIVLFLCCFCFVAVAAFICMFCIFYDVLHILVNDKCAYSLILCWYFNYRWDFCLLGNQCFRPVTTAHQYQRIMQPSQWHSTSSAIQCCWRGSQHSSHTQTIIQIRIQQS
jgi:hypothetical protein